MATQMNTLARTGGLRTGIDMLPSREGESGLQTSFGGAVGALPQASGVGAPSSGGMGVTPGTAGSAAGALKMVLGPLGSALGSRELSIAAQALGGVAGVARLVNYVQKMPGGISGGLGVAGGVASVLGPVLNVMAQATGNKELGMAANAVGAAAGAIGLASTVITAPAVIGAVGALAAGASAGAAAGAAGSAIGGGVATGIGAGAGLAFAPIAAALLISQISGLAGGEDPFGEGIQDMMKPLMGDYASFYKDLGTTLEGSRTGLETMYKSLPYSQSQEDLGQIVDAFKAQQAQRIGGYGVGSDRFTIPNLPGAGGSIHEGKQIADFGPSVNQLNEVLQRFHGNLPATAAAGSTPGKSVWDQVLRETQTQGAVQKYGPSSTDVPAQMWARMPDGSFQSVSAAQMEANDAKNLAAQQDFEAGRTADRSAVGPGWAVAESVYYGDPRYNYAAAGVPPPPPPGMQTNLGAPSTYWEDLMRQPNAVPGVGQFQPGTIAQTGGMRAGIGQRVGAFGGARSPSLGGGAGTVDPSITTGLAGQNQGPQTGFISGAAKAV